MSDFDYFERDEVKQAVKDILYMYTALAYEYNGFGHGIDTGEFDPFKFIEIDSEKFEALFIPVPCQFLKNGSMIKILCEIYDAWCEYECFDFSQFDRHKLWLSDGRFWEYPEIEELMRRLFAENPSMSESWVDDAFQESYNKYVQRHFLEFASMNRQK